MELEQLLELLREYFADKEDVVTVYLFGSYAQGRERANSDVDLSVLFSPGALPYDCLIRQLDFANELENLLNRSVDIINLETATPFFVHQVFLDKKIVVDKDVMRRVEFEVEHRRTYFGMLPYYQLYHEQALKRLGED